MLHCSASHYPVILHQVMLAVNQHVKDDYTDWYSVVVHEMLDYPVKGSESVDMDTMSSVSLCVVNKAIILNISLCLCVRWCN